MIYSKSCDMDDQVQIKEEPLHHNEISNELQKPAVSHNETYFEVVPEKSELIICDTKIDIKQEPWHWNKTTTDIGSEMQKLPLSVIEPYMNTVVIKSDGDIKEEALHYTSSTEVTESAASAGSQNEEKLSNGEKKETSKLELPRFSTEAAYHDGNSITFLDIKEDVTSQKMGCGKNASQGSPMRQKICSLNCHPTCDCELFEPEHNRDDESTQVYKCEICEKCYTHKSSLKNHKMIHSGTTPYKCDKCQKWFTQKSDLQRHKLLHSGTKPHKCDICEKRFTQKSNLQSHVLLHSGTKPYKCDICGKCYTRKSDLQTHILLHSGTKPYKCEHCEKCFTQKSHLQRHTFLHSGTRPYKCDMCGKCFTRKSHLRRHTLQHK